MKNKKYFVRQDESKQEHAIHLNQEQKEQYMFFFIKIDIIKTDVITM